MRFNFERDKECFIRRCVMKVLCCTTLNSIGLDWIGLGCLDWLQIVVFRSFLYELGNNMDTNISKVTRLKEEVADSKVGVDMWLLDGKRIDRFLISKLAIGFCQLFYPFALFLPWIDVFERNDKLNMSLQSWVANKLLPVRLQFLFSPTKKRILLPQVSTPIWNFSHKRTTYKIYDVFDYNLCNAIKSSPYPRNFIYNERPKNAELIECIVPPIDGKYSLLTHLSSS